MAELPQAYDPSDYWERLLSERFSEGGVGYPELSVSLNRAMYKSLRASVARARRAAEALLVDPTRVLDVGCGTGIWVDYWRGVGAEDIVGVDITAAAVSALQARFPTATFVQADITEVDGAIAGGGFDIVSAMSVLPHVTDDTRFIHAIRNIAASLRPGGALVAIDAIVARRWWGPPPDEGASSKARGLNEWAAALLEAGLELHYLRPATCLLSNVIDTKYRQTFAALWLYWGLMARFVDHHERRGAGLGALIGPMDQALCRLLRLGPSAKVLVALRPPAIDSRPE